MRRYDLFKKEIILITSINDRFRTYKNYIEYNFFPLSNEGEEEIDIYTRLYSMVLKVFIQ